MLKHIRNAVSSGLEHVATRDSAAFWADMKGRNWTMIPVDGATGLVTPEDYGAAVSADTVLVTIVHTSNVTGLRVDLKGIVAAVRAKAPACYIICDGIQHAPHGSIHVRDDGVDAYVYAPYKAFCSQGMAVGWISDRIKTLPHEKAKGRPADDWDLGQRDPASFCVLTDVYDYLCWLGAQVSDKTSAIDQLSAAFDAITAHERALMARLMYGASGSDGLLFMDGVLVLGGDNLDQREGTLSFNVAGYHSGDLVDALDRAGFRTYRRLADDFDGPSIRAAHVNDIVRVSVGHYNTIAEMDLFLHALKKIAAS